MVLKFTFIMHSIAPVNLNLSVSITARPNVCLIVRYLQYGTSVSKLFLRQLNKFLAQAGPTGCCISYGMGRIPSPSLAHKITSTFSHFK